MKYCQWLYCLNAINIDMNYELWIMNYSRDFICRVISTRKPYSFRNLYLVSSFSFIFLLSPYVYHVLLHCPSSFRNLHFVSFYSFIFLFSPYVYHVLLHCPSSWSTSQDTFFPFSFVHFYIFLPPFLLFVCVLLLCWRINWFSRSRHSALPHSCVFPSTICPFVFLPPFPSFLFFSY